MMIPLNTSTVTIDTIPAAAGADRILVVGAHVESGSSIVTSVVLDPGGLNLGFTAGSPASVVENDSYDCSSFWYYLLDPPTGTYNIEINGNSSDQTANAMTFSGVNQFTPFGATSAVGISTGTTASTMLASAADQMVVDFVCTAGSPLPASLTVGAGQTEPA